MAFLLSTISYGWAQDMEKPQEGQAEPEKKPEEQKPTEVKPAQEDPFKWVEDAVKRLTERGGLTEEQVGKITEKVKTSLTEISKIRETATNELKELLGEETYNKIRRDLTRLLEGQRGGNQGGGNRGMQDVGKAMFDNMKKELGLTEEQVGKIQPVVDELSKKTRELFEEARNGGREGFQALGEKMRAEYESFSNKVKENLNDDQKAKFDELLKNMRDRMGPGRRNRGGGQDNPGGGDGGGQ
jgi:ribosomal protein S13